ncbi:MAG: succinoglycan biosynthesis protein exoa [Candidatus Binatia bacterium]|nr:MAG: succinoglycan biosynthesis protein exoa [Candidatus Binatia bacterium]
MTARPTETPRGASWPFVSVVLPCRNEEAYIGSCLESILAQDYPPDRMEVLVVDGASEDRTRAIVDEWSRRDARVRLLENPKRIVPTGLNLAIREARGDVVARIDAHTTFAPDYLRQGVLALRRTGAANVGGPMVARGGGPVGDAIAAALNSPFGAGAYFHYGTEEREVDTVYLGMWPRRVFEEVGLFDEELVRNQDDEFNYRLRKAGGRIFLVPTMRSSYQNRRDLRSLARQFYEYGFWKVRVCQKHPRQMSWRHFVPPALVLALASPALSWGVPPLGWLGLGGWAAYLAALGGMTASIRRRAGAVGSFRWLPLALAVMHTAWGVGFLVGAVRFAGLWLGEEPVPPRLATDVPGGAVRDRRSTSFGGEGCTW